MIETIEITQLLNCLIKDMLLDSMTLINSIIFATNKCGLYVRILFHI